MNEVSHELPQDIRHLMFVYEFLHTYALTTIIKTQFDLMILMRRRDNNFTKCIQTTHKEKVPFRKRDKVSFKERKREIHGGIT